MLETIVAIIFILFGIIALVGPFIITMKPSKKDKKNKKLQERQELANVFCDFYKTITGEEVQITVRLNSDYEYTINKEDNENV